MDTSLTQVLGEIQKTLGSIDGKLDSHLAAFERHVADDKALGDKVDELRLSAAKQKGFFAAWSAIGTAVGAGLGYMADRWIRG